MQHRLATLAWISSLLICGPSFAQDRPLVEQLPKDMAVERVMQIAQSALAARGWRVTSKQTTTIEAEDRNSRILLLVADGAIRYRDLAQSGRTSSQKLGFTDYMQSVPISAERIAELRTDLIAALSGSVAAADAGQLLLGRLPDNLTNDQILQVVSSALSGRRWVVLSGSSDTVVAEYANAVTEGRLKVFIVGRDLRYTDDGTKQKSSGDAGRLPENWIANLRADTAKGLRQLSTTQKAPAAANPRATAERLRALKELHDSGVITREEYDKKRAEILKEL